MRIAILGAGNMADALGTQWLRAGHDVMISGRDLARSTALAQRMTATAALPTDAASSRAGVVAPRPGVALAGTWAEAAGYGEVVMVAVMETGLHDVLRAVEPALRGKPVIDVTNAVSPDAYDVSRSLAELIAELTGGHVVKAFNLCHVDVWRMTPPVFDGRPLAVPLCGDEEHALATARTLVTDLGCTPVYGGGLGRAKLLEATAAFMIGLWIGGADAQAVLPPLERSGAHPTA
ncbi:NADPH-dependent F420 reductase [Nonomuraea sp. LPB2021202275-12-8]|uniref:NADPH-dependent F420 reductase n=1 Tax=Nonomuraea sp. LPB2021202275-12-8 TaxID=3120159 RepID=UPI00300DB903